MNTFKRFVGHFKTVTKHRHTVIKHCKKAGILWQGLRHDLSKYSLVEFVPGVKYYTGMRSPNEGEREDIGCSKAWMHHKGRNKHHFEYWRDIDIETKVYKPIEMPYKYVVEMFCDRVAASKIYNKEKYTDNDALEYFNRGKLIRSINPKTSGQLEELLVMLSEKGEEETFKYIRENLKRMKH